MIEDLENIFNEIKEYRLTMHEGTISVLADNWITMTRNLITELKTLE